MPSTGNLPTIYHEEFLPIFNRWKEKKTTSLTESEVQQYYLMSQLTNFANVLWYDNTNIGVPGSFETDMLTSEDIAALLIVYDVLYPGERNTDTCDLHFTVKKFSSIFVGAEKFGSQAESRSLRSAKLLASWHDGEGQVSATSPLFPGIVDYFMGHKLTVDGVDREHYFAYVRWFKKHPHKQCLGNFNSLCVWDGSNFEARAPNCFLPVHRIHSLFAGAYLFVDEAKLMVVCPIPRRASILTVR